MIFFSRLATEYGLHLTYVKEFHEVFADNQEHAEFGPLLEKMKVVDANGESSMDEDQWEAASECDPPSYHPCAHGSDPYILRDLRSISAAPLMMQLCHPQRCIHSFIHR